MTQPTNYTDDERVDAFARALGVALRRIVDDDRHEKPQLPGDLPVPVQTERNQMLMETKNEN